MAIRIATPADQKIWDDNVSHPLQSWAWGQFRQAMRIEVIRLVETHNGKISGCWQITRHPIPLTPWAVGYCPKGPLPTSGLLQELSAIGRGYNLIFVQLEPNVIKATQEKNPNPQYFNLVPSHRPLFTKYTFLLDLTKSQDNLLKNMHSKTRYNLKLAQRHGVKIQEDNSEAAFFQYLKLENDTTRRQGFYAHNDEYHQTMWRIMKQAGIAHLFTATYQGQPLAAWIVFKWKDTIYYPYGASSRDQRHVMAPNLLLWEIARWGKSQGAQSFDLWGAIGPNPKPDDPWFGFHRFKEGYGPQLVEFVGSYDFVLQAFQYQVFCLMDNIRWALLKLLRH